MERETILTIVIFILMILTALQSFQLNELREAVSEGKVTFGGVSPNQQVLVPSNINNLPSMVGGC